jgi:hypothetical protein
MLASPNFMFGISNGASAKPDTPKQALRGSVKVTEAFRDWFKSRQLPWDYTNLDGRSDYGPFLAGGVVSGGLFSGAETIKSFEQRNAYLKLLSDKSLAGVFGAAYDPCYHLACDNVENINRFAFERMTQAAAHVLEFLGQKNDLEVWLYPDGRL